jgi:signal recognition particle receptor subunit beta
MVSINYAFREISCKIVFYGPGLSGKTTNLQYVHQKVPGKTKGELISLATDADRTLYFDFLPINLGAIQGFATKFQLYTVPGQVYYNATRKLVLRGVDGVVFVADSQRAKMDENIESLNNLYDNLKEYGFATGELPVVIQYNKRDLPEVMSIEELQATLNPQGFPYFEASAVNGTGVFDTLKMVIKLVLDKARSRSELSVKSASPTAPAATVAPTATAAPAGQGPAAPQVPAPPAPAPEVQPASPQPVGVTAAPVVLPEAPAGPMPEPAGAPSQAMPAAATVVEPHQAAATVTQAPPQAGVVAPVVAPAQGEAASSASSASSPGGVEINFDNMTAAPTVIPPAPSLKRASEPKKKRSFWRKLFKWI